MVEIIIVGVCIGAIKDNSVEKVEATNTLLKFTSSPKFKSILVCIFCGAFLIYPLIIFIVGISWAASYSSSSSSSYYDPYSLANDILRGVGIFFIIYSVIEAVIGGVILSILLGVMTQTEVVMDKVEKTMKIVSRKALCCLCFGSVEKTFSFNDIVKIEQVNDAICCGNQGATGFTVCTNQETYTPKRANVTVSYVMQMQEFLQRAKFEEANPGAVAAGPYPLQGYALPPGAAGVAMVPGGAYPGYPPQGYAYPPQGLPPQGYPPQGYAYPPQGLPPQGYAYPPQGLPPQGYPPQGYPPHAAQAYLPQAGAAYAAAAQEKPPQEGEGAPPAAPAGSV